MTTDRTLLAQALECLCTCTAQQRECQSALRARLAEPEPEPVAWLVLDRNGYVMHAASWRDAAHEHINDAINEHDLVCAREWRVVPAYAVPPARTARPDDTDARVQRIMEAAEKLALAATSLESFTAATQGRKLTQVDAARAELERVVRESLSPPGS